VLARCSMGDGAGNCAGQTRYERVVQEGVCNRHNCAYYAYPRPRSESRWAGGSTGESSISDGTASVKPSSLAGTGEATIGRQSHQAAIVKSGHGCYDQSSYRYYNY